MQHDSYAERFSDINAHTHTHTNTCGNISYQSCIFDFVVHFSPLLILHHAEAVALVFDSRTLKVVFGQI